MADAQKRRLAWLFEDSPEERKASRQASFDLVQSLKERRDKHSLGSLFPGGSGRSPEQEEKAFKAWMERQDEANQLARREKAEYEEKKGSVAAEAERYGELSPGEQERTAVPVHPFYTGKIKSAEEEGRLSSVHERAHLPEHLRKAYAGASSEEEARGIDPERVAQSGIASMPKEGEAMSPEEAEILLAPGELEEAQRQFYSKQMSVDDSDQMSLEDPEVLTRLARATGLPKKSIIKARKATERSQGERPPGSLGRSLAMDSFRARNNEDMLALAKENSEIRARQKKNVEKHALLRAEVQGEEDYHLFMKDNEAMWAKGERDKAFEAWRKRQIKANKLTDRLVTQATTERQISGWDIFKKSALGIGAVLAAAGTVVGQGVFAKKGAKMPNVLMPLIMKAIDADVFSMRQEKKSFIDKAGVAVNYAAEVRKNFKSEAESIKHMKNAGLLYWDKMLEREKKRLSLNGQKNISDIQDAINLELNKNQMEDMEKESKLIEGNIQSASKTLNQEAIADYNRSNADDARYKATKTLRELQNADDYGLDKMPAKEEGHTTERIHMLQEIPEIKMKLVRLFKDTAMPGGIFDESNLKEALTVSTVDFISKWTRRQYPDNEKLANEQTQRLVKTLKTLQRVYATNIEGRGLTNQDAGFYEDALGLDLDTVSILSVINGLARVEYHDKLKVISSLSSLSAKARGAWDDKIRTISGGVGVHEVMSNFRKSLRANIDRTKNMVPFNVGVVDINLSGELMDARVDRLVNEWKAAVVSSTSSDRPHKGDQAKQQAQLNEASGIVNPRDNKQYELVPIPTKDGKEAYLPKEKADRWIRFKRWAKKINPALNFEVTGHRSGARTAEMTAELRAEGKEPSDHGLHTEHGGYRGLDIALGGFDTPEYKFMREYGKLWGIVPGHTQPGEPGTYKGYWHWVFEDEIPSEAFRAPSKG